MREPSAQSTFIRGQTRLLTPPLVPEMRYWGADALTPIWEATEAELASTGLPPPFWAFAWPGGLALARYLLDHPSHVAGTRVFALGAGAAVEVIAAKMAGAASATANDVDPLALAAAELNAAANGVSITLDPGDYVSDPQLLPIVDVYLAGDIFYEKTLSARLEALLRPRAEAGALVLIGDPGRHYLPRADLEPLAEYRVPTDPVLEDVSERRPKVLRLLPSTG
ncbi:MAG: 50S ribosomal protein L11 methyltransferase [Pseudomonadota bacterium]